MKYKQAHSLSFDGPFQILRLFCLTMNPDSDLSPNHTANKNSNTLEFTLEKLMIPSI